MAISLSGAFEWFDSWTTEVNVTVSPGRDRDGHSRTGETQSYAGCLIAPGAMSESETGGVLPTPGEVTEDQATIYGPPDLVVPATGTITIPDGHPLAGVWEVVGNVKPWPDGTVVTVRRRS